MVLVDLYFGRDIAGRPPLTDAEWAAFARTQIIPRFPDGFTVIDARGQWLNPANKTIDAEPSKMVRIATAPGTDLPARLIAITDAYRAQFHQISVGVTNHTICGAF